ncbi:methyltransferase domain-containing protein, partial [archaeon]
SYALARSFEEVVGIDFSHSFVAAANELKVKGSLPYEALRQGCSITSQLAQVPGDVDRSRVIFQQGDACALDRNLLGRFDLVVACNLLCRLPEPSRFLLDIPHFLRERGVLLLVSPYSWLEEYTERSRWLGGIESEDSSSAVQRILQSHEVPLTLRSRQDLPFLIREHERKFQFGVSEATVWQRS